jgi:choline dehydrogenase-like flavoprotein
MPLNFDAIVIDRLWGAIAAIRLAAKGMKALMLERGTWWVAGNVRAAASFTVWLSLLPARDEK